MVKINMTGKGQYNMYSGCSGDIPMHVKLFKRFKNEFLISWITIKFKPLHFFN